MSNELIYFDVNAGCGAYPNKPPEARWSLDHLLEDMDLAGIAGALVFHHQAIYSEAMEGNRRLVGEIQEHRERLFPCWVALPSIGGDFPLAGDFVREMKDHAVKAVRIDTAHFEPPISESVWRPLRDALGEIGALCLFVAEYGGGNLHHIDRLLEIFKGVQCVLLNHGWMQWRNVCALMEGHPHLHLEFSHFQANRAMEYFAGRFGVERCLFGTGLPHRAPGAARGFLDFSLLPRDQAQQAAGGNLRRLLGGIGPRKPPPASRWHDALTTSARAGVALDGLVMDAHCHIGHDGCRSLAANIVAIQGDADGMIELTRRSGIKKTAIMSWAGPLAMESRRGNEIVAEAVRRYPDEVLGLATVNAEYDDPKTIDQIIRRYHDELGFAGLKTFTPNQTIDYDDPLLERWLTYGNEHRLYLVLDPKGGMAATKTIENLARRYPDLSIHLDHCGQSWEYAKWAAELALRHNNIFAQLNYTLVTNGVIEYLVDHISAERVLFGTDAPMRDPRPQLAWVVFTRLHERQKRLILGENFARQLALRR